MCKVCNANCKEIARTCAGNGGVHLAPILSLNFSVRFLTAFALPFCVQFSQFGCVRFLNRICDGFRSTRTTLYSGGMRCSSAASGNVRPACWNLAASLVAARQIVFGTRRKFRLGLNRATGTSRMRCASHAVLFALASLKQIDQ